MPSFVALVKMWDRRIRRYNYVNEMPTPCGVFVGHQCGLTFISSKDDGRYFLSNSKDQCIKLWDARKCTSNMQMPNVQLPPRHHSFDYRGQRLPRIATGHEFHDDSVATYGGSHETLKTLIRARFSPMHSTGQRYIYCGSSDGSAAIYDVITGKEVAVLRGHREVVRDVSWHPYGPFLTTGSWDGQVVVWSTYEDQEEKDVEGGWSDREYSQVGWGSLMDI